MKESVKNLQRNEPGRARQEQGFSLLQLVVALAIIIIVATFATMAIARARASMRLQNSARLLAGNMEKARIDAIRRRSSAQVEVTSSNTYDVTMDFNGGGAATVTTRRFKLENGVVFTDSANVALTIDASGNCTSCPAGELVPAIDFDRRGRTWDCSMLFRLQNSNNEKSTVQVMGSGDITVDSTVSNTNAITYSNVNSTSDVVSSTVVKTSSSTAHTNFNPCDTSGSASNSNNETIGAGGCKISVSPTLITVRRNGSTSASVNVNANTSGRITAAPDSNLTSSPAYRDIGSSAGGTVSFSISSVNRIRGVFPVNFTNSCGTTGIQVKVTN